MANSWMNAAGSLGFELRLACPEGYEPDHEIYERNAKLTRISITELPEEAVAGAHVVTTDVWASMGQEQEAAVRAQAFQGYVVDEKLMGAGQTATPSSCTVSPPTAVKRSARRCSRARTPGSGIRPRTGCMSRRHCC